jgi:hypothetical protein
MGKSDEKQTKKIAHKATTDGESKHKNKPSFDILENFPLATTSKDTDAAIRRHSQWRDHFRQLCEYKVQFGDCIVPQQYSVNPKLRRWINQQRKNYKLYMDEKPSLLTAELIRALQGVGFEWRRPNDASWNERFEQLREFKAQFGHYLVPLTCPANTKLGTWVRSQRRNYKLYQEGKPSVITAEHIRELDSVGFVWDPLAAFWSLRFRQLRGFKAQFGHCFVPFRYPANPQLGKWVTTQRQNFKLSQEGKPSVMTPERVQALQYVGFVWDANAAVWNECFEQLLEFKAQFGHCLVPQQYSANSKLGRWVANQRYTYKLYQEGTPCRMTAERVRKLESVGFFLETYTSSRGKQSIV